MGGILARHGKLAGLAILVWAGIVGAQGSKPAATVNGEVIPMSEIDAVISQRSPDLFPLPRAQQRQLRHDVLDALISERLMRQFLSRNGPKIDSKEIDRQMQLLADVQKAAGKTLEDYCRETKQTKEQIRLSVQNMLQFSAYMQQKATDAELKKYFQENIEFFQKVTVRVSHIVIRVPAEAPIAERQAARAKLSDLRQQIVSGKVAFADAAREHSQCPSALKGGDLGYITRKWMVDESVAKAAFALKKDVVSDIVESEFGLHLLLVTDRTAPKPIEFVACVDDVRDCFLEETRQKLLADLRAKAKIDIHIE